MRLGIRARIFALCLPAMVLPPLWVGHQASMAESERARVQSEAELRQQALAAQRRLADHIHRVEVDLAMLLRLPAFRDFVSYRDLALEEEARVQKDRLQEVSDTLTTREHSFAAAGFLDADGAPLAWSGRQNAVPALAARLRESGRSSRPPGVHWLPALTVEGHLLAPVVTEMLDPWGVPQGSVCLLLDVNAVLELLGQPGTPGQLLLRPPGQGVYRTGRCGTGVSPDRQARLVRLVSLTAAPGTRELTTPDQEKHLFMQGRPHPSGWQLGVLVPAARLREGVERIRQQTLELTLLGGLGACLLAAWIARRIGGRIHELAEQAVAIGEGNFEIEVSDQQDDELGQLAGTMHDMGLRIQETQQALARRIEDIQNARIQLVQAEKLSAIGVLSSGIAHEIHSPLQSISATASCLRLLESRQQVAPGELAEIARDITDAVAHATQVTSALQQYARVTREEPEQATVSLEEVAQRCLTLLRGRRDASRVALEIEGAPCVRGDLNQLVQVLMNLVRNALDASSGPQAVSVRITEGRFTAEELRGAEGAGPAGPFREARPRALPEAGAQAVQVEVHDQGPGIPEEHLLRVFDPFFTTKPPGSGTGLGLSIAQGIVRMHGGLLSVRSTPGAGTTVSVKLPAYTGKDAP